MYQRLSPLDLRKRLGDILNRVSLRHDQYIIERRGKPIAAIVPVEKLEWLDKAARSHLLAVLDRQGGDLTPEEADRLADEAKHESRVPRAH